MKRFCCSALFALIALALSLVPSLSSAASIPGLFTTGVDASGNVLAGGAVDPHYYTVAPTFSQAFVITDAKTPPNWMSNDATSKWIWQQADAQSSSSSQTFRLSFDLTGLDPTTASITGEWATDNFGDDILINGVSTGHSIVSTPYGFQNYTPFSITAGFQPGVNTLDFIARDETPQAAYKAGFRIGSISGTATAIPEPTSAVLLASFGLASFLCRRRRRTQ